MTALLALLLAATATASGHARPSPTPAPAAPPLQRATPPLGREPRRENSDALSNLNRRRRCASTA